MCGLQAQFSDPTAFDQLARHMQVWVADECSQKLAAQDWPMVSQFVLSRYWRDAKEVQADSGYQSKTYSQFAVFKAVMPFAATLLGYETITQDVDVVWKTAGRMLPYLESFKSTLIVIRSTWNDKFARNANGGFQFSRPTGVTLWLYAKWLLKTPIILFEKVGCAKARLSSSWHPRVVCSLCATAQPSPFPGAH